MTDTNSDFEIVFDGIVFDCIGSITLQTEDYVHHYQYDESYHAVEVTKKIMDGVATVDRDQNEPEHRLDHGTSECIIFDEEDITRTLSQSLEEDFAENIQTFFGQFRGIMGG